MSVSLSIGTTPNYATVSIGALTLEFSYSTVIAFRGPDDSAVSVNAWGPTTGKHINRIDGGNKKSRVERDEFTSRLNAQLDKLGLS